MRRKKIRWQWLLAVIISLLMYAVPALAGDLNPSAPPGPTMKTLDQILPTWDQVLPASERFKLVMGGAAVLDKETGLVWTQSPMTTPANWRNAQVLCNIWTNVGGRIGWRLPTVQELASLVDKSVSGTPKLPSGHPFSNVQSSNYWSATTNDVSDTTRAWGVMFDLGSAGVDAKNNANYVWCVRGGQGPDSQ